jgi:hypothetical protein
MRRRGFSTKTKVEFSSKGGRKKTLPLHTHPLIQSLDTMDNHDLENNDRYSGKGGIFERVEGEYAPGEPIKCTNLSLSLHIQIQTMWDLSTKHYQNKIFEEIQFFI